MSAITEHSESFEDLKNLTIKLQNSFLGSKNNDVKWILLKDYKVLLINRYSFSRALLISYQSVISTLLDSLNATLFSNASQESLFDEVILQGIQHEALLSLVNKLSRCDKYGVQKILKLLQKFFLSSSIDDLLKHQCSSHKDWDLKFVSKSNVWDNIITALTSLPERVANVTKGQFVKLFAPDCYFSVLFSSVLRTLTFVHGCLQNSQDCSVEFLAKLTGKMCIIGKADIICKIYSKNMIALSEFDFIWRRISRTFITKLPSSCLDSFIPTLLLDVPWYGFVEWILEDEGSRNEKIKYLMTTKLLFIKTFKQNVLLQNIIGYFASSPSRAPVFYEITNCLLDAWMDKRSLNLQNSEQKMYLASALMVCAGWVEKSNRDLDTKAFINKILKGTQMRLESTEEAVRSQGMFVAENFIRRISPDAPPLQFEFRETAELNRLKMLLVVPERPTVDFNLDEYDLNSLDETRKVSDETDIGPQNNSTATSNIELLDSDDELEAYDLPQETSQNVKRPLYIRECMKGLIEQEDAEFTEQCLLHAEELIKKNPYAAKEVAEEMSKVLLHLDNKFSFDNFVPLRHKIMITLTVESPVVVSNYLISQFCARDYNIRQRLDILEVLASASMAISYPNSLLDSAGHQNLKDPVSKRQAEWQLLSQERIEARTRRFTKAQELTFSENKFSAIAGQFFFPLLGCYEKKNSHFDVKRDHYVLSRFISTLGIIMYAATNTVHCREMGQTCLQFLSTLQNHSDVSVRHSIIFAVAATYMSVPFSVLCTEMLTELADTNDWLQSVIEKDPENSCIERAIYTYSILESKAREKLYEDVHNFEHLQLEGETSETLPLCYPNLIRLKP